jgi:hypothetical protein
MERGYFRGPAEKSGVHPLKTSDGRAESNGTPIALILLNTKEGNHD